MVNILFSVILGVITTVLVLQLLPYQSNAKYRENTTLSKNIYVHRGRHLMDGLTGIINANGILSSLNSSTKHNMLQSDATEPTASPTVKDDHGDGKGGKHSRVILSLILLCMFVLILICSLWIFRESIAIFCKRLWIKFRHSGMQVIWRRRGNLHSNQPEDGTLNDIIFDPDEENSSNLADSLLGS